MWKKKLSESKYHIHCIHRNEQPHKLKELTIGLTPCVILLQNDNLKILFDSQELASINGNINKFFKLLNKKLDLII